MKELVKKFSYFEWGMILAVIGFTIYFSIVDTENSLGYLIVDGVAAISGIFCVVLCAKGKKSQYIWGLINVLGYVITVTNHEGYGGDIQFSVGIRNDGTVNGVSILDIAETAGLGMKADPVLKDQFVNKNVAQFVTTKTGATGDDQIDAISGATITSDAFVRGANAALNHFQAIQADPTIAVILPDNPEEGGNGNE